MRTTPRREAEMNEIIGQVFSIAKENEPIPGCTVSKEVASTGGNSVTYFSLAEQTDISAEIYTCLKFLIVVRGTLEVYTGSGQVWRIGEQECLITSPGIPVGMRTKDGAIYTEITIRREDIMNQTIKPGIPFNLAKLLPYREGKIINMDVTHNDKMKFVVMSFDAGTGLSEHAAPGEALIFALDGEAIIGYEGKEHTIHAGENFAFAKGGAHWVKAEKRFKMALLLTLE